jgi:hypothetical protein
MMRRIKDYRQGYNYTITEKVSSNFYPINSKISIKDRINYIYNETDYINDNSNNNMIIIYNDRSQSGGVMKQGEIILLLNRYSQNDDWKGLSGPLLEISSSQDYFITKHYLLLGNNININNNIKYIHDLIHNKPIFISDINKRNKLYSKINEMIYITDNIIINYHILNQNKFFIQIFNSLDPYFNNEIDKEYIEFKILNNIDYTITEYHMSGTYNIDLTLKPNEINKLYIQQQDFRLFLIEIL